MPYKDPEKQRLAQHNHYLNNKDSYKKTRDNRRNYVDRLIQQAKEGKSCVFCNESFVPCLDFHHVNPSEKEGTPGIMRRDAWKKDKVLAEIAKCVLVCSNCHRKIHHGSTEPCYAELQSLLLADKHPNTPTFSME